jgi:hypothetical protein
MNILEKLPSKAELMKTVPRDRTFEVNGHFHTPFSFSAFDRIDQAFEMAIEEGVEVVGINDFITMDGYPEFSRLAEKTKRFPLYNIEFMGLLKKEQEQGIRVNDPNNPGRTYFSGKGLDNPVKLPEESARKLKDVFQESMQQTREMVRLLNEHLKQIEIGFTLPFEEIQQKFAKSLVRERHIAKAVRSRVYELQTDEAGRKVMLQKIFSGKALKSNVNDVAAVDNEIRSNLLKAGGKAYVAEDPKAFLEIPEVIRIILDAGGVPCYPVLLDDPQDSFTEYEKDYQSLLENLRQLNVYCIELIPGRNKYARLEEFVNFFDQNDFVILFGTEHNTPAMQPLTVFCEGNMPLSTRMKKIGSEGAAVIAAHQYLRAKGETGFVDRQGKPTGDRAEFINLGQAVIESYLKS